MLENEYINVYKNKISKIKKLKNKYILKITKCRK
jgi:hypothetical protein